MPRLGGIGEGEEQEDERRARDGGCALARRRWREHPGNAAVGAGESARSLELSLFSSSRGARVLFCLDNPKNEHNVKAFSVVKKGKVEETAFRHFRLSR